jgi:hypothetical protein
VNRDLLDWIWSNSWSESFERLVLLALAHKANVLGETTIKVTELAVMCRCDEGTVKTSLRKLVADKEITIFQNRDHAGNRTTNTYKFVVAGAGIDGEDDIKFDDPLPNLPGIPAPKVRDLPKEPQAKLMMDKVALAAIAADPIYQGINVNEQAWKFKRWCAAHKKDETVRRFKVWLARV